MKNFIHVLLTTFCCIIALNALTQRCPTCTGYNINETSVTMNIGSVSQSSTGDDDWNNLTNSRMTSSDGSVAHNNISTISIGSSTSLETVTANFTGFSIPTTKRICAVDFRIVRSYSFSGASLNATITDAVTVGGSASSTASQAWSTSTQTVNYTAAGSFTAAGINSSGISASIRTTASATISVSLPLHFEIDQLQVVVYYSDPCPLPVSLTTFIGQSSSESNKVSWQTESEINSDYFIVENRVDGNHDWTSIAQLNAAGTSLEENHYTFQHDNYQRNTINYYRLKQVDLDGTVYTYDDVISVDNRNTTKKIVRIVNMLGQDVDLHAPGIVMIYYDDGTNVKVVNQ